MPFSDTTKKLVLERASYRCCVCQRPGITIEVHHIVPQALGGDDSEENAAPLCPTCHADYGDNAVKQKAIRERRDFWYRQCKNAGWTGLAERLELTATKEDLGTLGRDVAAEVMKIINQPAKDSAEIKRELGAFTGTLGWTASALFSAGTGTTFEIPEGMSEMGIIRASSGAASDYAYGIATIKISSPRPIFNVSAVALHDQVHVWPLKPVSQIGIGKQQELALKVEWAKRNPAVQEPVADSFGRRFHVVRPRDPGPPWAPLYVTFETENGQHWAAVAYMKIERQSHGFPETQLLYGPHPFGWVRAVSA